MPHLGGRCTVGRNHDRDDRRRRSDRVPVELADRPAPRGRGGAVPPDLDRPVGGPGHRDRAAGARHASTDDARPAQEHPRRDGGAGHEHHDHRAAGRRVPRRDRLAAQRFRFEISSRPSDAIALAVRLGCKIFANEDVLEEASILIPADGEEEEKQLQEFREFLENVTPEDFEWAATRRTARSPRSSLSRRCSASDLDHADPDPSEHGFRMITRCACRMHDACAGPRACRRTRHAGADPLPRFVGEERSRFVGSKTRCPSPSDRCVAWRHETMTGRSAACAGRGRSRVLLTILSTFERDNRSRSAVWAKAISSDRIDER